jgi:hypothetical protein
MSLLTASRVMMLLTVLAVGVSACSSSSPRSAAILNGVQGEQVSSICFNRNINDWHELSPGSVILRANRSDYYRVDLVGVCQPDQAFSTIQIQSRSGLCLEQGDRIGFDNDLSSGSCSVSRIYRWLPAPLDTTGSE